MLCGAVEYQFLLHSNLELAYCIMAIPGIFFGYFASQRALFSFTPARSSEFDLRDVLSLPRAF